MAEVEKDRIRAVKFVNSSLIAPPKRDVLAYLGIPIEPGKPAEEFKDFIIRKAETDVSMSPSWSSLTYVLMVHQFLDPVTGYRKV